MSTELTDNSPMPFGKHKGKPMKEVPASYLFWVWTQLRPIPGNLSVHNYISKNKPALEKEHPDGIW